MTNQEAHDMCREHITNYFTQHGVFPSELEVTIEVLWQVVDYCRQEKMPINMLASNRAKPYYAFYGVRLTPAQDLSVVDSIIKARCIG